MKKFYISPKEDVGEIGKYSRRFYQQILKEMGYIHIDSKDSIINILTAISSRDHTHIEISASQKKEVEILFTMLRANYRNVSVTLHDAPFIKHPFYEFKNPVLNQVSRFLNKYANSFGAPNAVAKKIKTIYVFSQKEMDIVKRKYGVNNVHYLPFIDEKIEMPAVQKEIRDHMILNADCRELSKTTIE